MKTYLYALVVLGLCGLAIGGTKRIQNVDDLQTDGKLAKSLGIPIVLEFAAADCPYCRRLEEDIINPMVLSGDYTNEVLLRKVDIFEADQIIGFNGHPVSQKELAKYYRVNLTPTVLILDHKGKELVPRIVGVSSIEFYGTYLEGDIKVAQEIIKNNSN